MSDPIRIVLADDHPVLREGMALMLETQPDFMVVGQAADGATAITQTLEQRPDLLMLDLDMPGVDGVMALRRIRQEWTAARVLVFTAFDTDERIIAAVQAGAQGYLLKGAPREEVFNAIRIVAAGGSLLDPVVAHTLIRHVAAGRAPEQEPLSSRQIEVLRLISQGLANKQIAVRLSISERTVKFHVSALLERLHAANRTEAVTTANRLGILS